MFQRDAETDAKGLLFMIVSIPVPTISNLGHDQHSKGLEILVFLFEWFEIIIIIIIIFRNV